MALNLLDYYKQQERSIYGQLYPMEQAALEMERVATNRTSEQPSMMDRLFQHLGTAGVPGTIGVGLLAKGLGAPGITPKEVLMGPDLPRPTTKAEYDRLAPGTRYIHPDKGTQTKR
jgi:hypothetical protein